MSRAHGPRIQTPSDDASAFARLLVGIRLQRGWTQQHLAGELGVYRETVSRWERGERDPHPTWVAAVRALLAPAA